jgi:hypothetical protein
MRKNGRWFRLALGITGVGLFVVLLHLLSGSVPGSTGALIEHNRRKQIEVGAYFYSEVGDLKEFLDDQSGRYGRASLQEEAGLDSALAGHEATHEPSLTD